MTHRLFACAVGFAAGLLVLSHDAAAQILHTPHDHVPNFAANPTIRSAASGAWCSNVTSRPEIDGITCPLNTSTPPSQPTGLGVVY